VLALMHLANSLWFAIAHGSDVDGVARNLHWFGLGSSLFALFIGGWIAGWMTRDEVRRLEDLDLLVTAINIQHEVGGNLAQILDVMGETIRERVRIKGEIRVLTAQGQISGYIITALPIAIGAFIFLVNPDYISEMFVWPWICMPIGGVILIGLGFFAMQKIVQIEV
jgi:Flp pilus assembly protein TadB